MKKILIVLFFISISLLLHATTEFAFRRIEVKDGLSNNQINHIFKDAEGYIWFSTASGLNRFDGNKIKSFKGNSAQKELLFDNYIHDVQQDYWGQIWVRTGSGYIIYNPETEQFDQDVREWMGQFGIEELPTLMLVGMEQEMWFYIPTRGIYLLHPETKSLQGLLYADGKMPDGEPSNLVPYKEGLLLLFNDGKVTCVHRETAQQMWEVDDIPVQLGVNKQEYFNAFVDSDDDVWIYGPWGLWVYSPTEQRWKSELLLSLQGETHKMIRSVSQDAQGRIWIGKDQDGVDVLDKKSKEVIRLMHNPNDERSLQNNTINALYSDPEGSMWVGTYKKGVSFYNESTFKFGLSALGDINSIEEDRDGTVWLGTNDTGLLRWNRRTGRVDKLSHQLYNSLSADVVVTLLTGSDGKLWIGTFWGGLDCYDKGTFTHYKQVEGNSNSLANNNVWSLAEDKEGHIWIGTLGGGVQCFNPSTKQFTTYNVANSNLLSDYVFSFTITQENVLLMGTDKGLSMLDLQTRTITNFTETQSGDTKLSNLIINQVCEDSRGLIWLGTREGLNVYNPMKDELALVPIKGEQIDPFIAGIVEDDLKNMWVSTSNGVSNITPTLDSKTGKYEFRVHSYDKSDGLQQCEFNLRSIKKLSTGELLFGGLYGVNSIQPTRIKYNQAHPKVFFTELSLFNEKIEIGKEYNGKVLLEKSLNFQERVELDYEQNIVAIQFSSDNYVQPEKITYSYKLDGFSEEWMNTTVGKVTYTNLAPGKYTLRVKATNSDGFSSGEESQLQLVVKPPFWLTIWAYLIYATLFLLLLLLGRYLILRGERSKFKIQQMEQEVVKNQEVNDMKLRFFTNVSHDLRTPLTLIISPLETLIKEHQSDHALVDKMTMIHRNATRLLNLVNQLLDFRKADVSGHRLNLSDGDVVEYIQTLCASFATLSEKKGVHLTTFSAVRSLPISFDVDKVGKIVMNLLSNAFKFTPQGGRVDVAMDVITVEGEELFELKVSDTGIGIKEEEKEQVFERFFQGDTSKSRATGSGVGLHIVKEFVQLHGGTVRVIDNVPQGSVFFVTIPCKRVASVALSTSETVPQNEWLKEHEAATSEEVLDDALVTDKAIESSQKEVLKYKQKPRQDKRPILLVVDDNDDFLTFMYDSLHSEYQIKLAANGCEAWELMGTTTPDLVISDVMMPEMDGNELCRLAKKNRATEDIPFILLTSRQTNEHKVEGLNSGADDYITKPFSMEILTLRVRKLLELRAKKGRSSQLTPEPSEIVITSMDEKLFEQAVKYIEANITRSDLSVEELSQQLGMSRASLYKKLLAITGKTPIEFIRTVRIKRGAQLLRESQQNVSEVAYQVGFNSPKYFSKYFKDEYGVLPSTYQERESN
ncbi:MAG: hybrid sensor histidine kinase/response regulator transcription factor [Phocaeicola sp.]